MSGTIFPTLYEEVVRIYERSVRAEKLRHNHVCFRCRKTYPCLVQFAPYCTPPKTLQECAEYLCVECQAISDDEEL